MRTGLSLFLAFTLLAASPAVAAIERPMSVVEWLNHEARMAPLVLLGQVMSDAYPDPVTGRMDVTLTVGEVFTGPKVGPFLKLPVKPGYVDGRFLPPDPLKMGQWVLFFVRKENGKWVAPPFGRVVETPYQGLTFVPGLNVQLEDAARGLSWDYVLDAMSQIIQTRHEVINGHLAKMRAARTREAKELVKQNIEWQVKEQLGLPMP